MLQLLPAFKDVKNHLAIKSRGLLVAQLSLFYGAEYQILKEGNNSRLFFGVGKISQRGKVIHKEILEMCHFNNGA